MSSGFVKVSRDILEHPFVRSDNDVLAVVMYLIQNAAYSEHSTWLGGKSIKLMPGQLATGRKQISYEANVEEHKVDRILNVLKSEHLIEQQTSSRGRLISLLFWDSDEKSEQQNEQQMSSKWATNEQQMSTTEERKKVIKEDIKEKRVSKDTLQKKTQTSLVEESDLPEELKPKVLEWLKYKSEKKQGYKETGLKALLSQITKYANTLGTATVSDRIDVAMAGGWQGMNLDKVETKSAPRAAPVVGSYDPDLQREAEENFRRMMEERNAVSGW